MPTVKTGDAAIELPSHKLQPNTEYELSDKMARAAIACGATACERTPSVAEETKEPPKRKSRKKATDTAAETREKAVE